MLKTNYNILIRRQLSCLHVKIEHPDEDLRLIITFACHSNYDILFMYEECTGVLTSLANHLKMVI